MPKKKSIAKTYVLDTNILIQQPNSIFGFEDNNVVITGTTLQELDRKKTAPGELGYHAREAIRIIDSLRPQGDYIEGIPLPHGGKFYIDPDGIHQENLPQGFDISAPDNRIISSVITRAKNTNAPVILITNDVSMRINAVVCGVETQGYHNEEIDDEDNIYTGRCDAYLSGKAFSTLMGEGAVAVNKEITFYSEDNHIVDVEENEFCLVRDSDSPNDRTALAMYREGMLYRIKDNEHPFGITGRNIAQKFALHALMAPPEEIPLVILRGPAGCAKTFLSLAAGLDESYRQGYSSSGARYQKVMITRNNVLSDADMGFLPGTLEEKMGPLVAPFIDNLEVLLKANTKEESMDQIHAQIDDLLDEGILEICSMAYMRGRSITGSYLIIDEAQNATVGQILEIISRAGMGTKVIVAGDPDQIDNPKLDKINNGLVFAAEKMKGSKLCAQLTFDQEESVRSPLAMEAAKRLTL